MANKDEDEPLVLIQVCFAAQSKVGGQLVSIHIPPDSAIQDALEQMKLPQIFPEMEGDFSRVSFAIFGKRKPLSYKLQEGDRVELCLPLIAHPMDSRRHRAKREHKSGKM
jgi:putative ubiquitin-RnfH superfamily antitoxin RatB of RatAB toxin-antitoxin module